VKEIMLENGLDSDDFVNKYGRNTLVIYMTKERVPPEVAMNI
jgi:DNA primase